MLAEGESALPDLAAGSVFVAARADVAGREVLELRVLALERQLHRADRAVTLLGDDDLGDARLLGFLVVVLVAVDKLGPVNTNCRDIDLHRH